MDIGIYLRFVLVLVLVIGLILALAWVLKRFGLGSGLHGTLGRKRRLSTIESTALDGRHRVVLVRRDDVEHLLLVGPNTSQVIERGIPVSASDSEPPPPMAPGLFSQFLPKDKEP